MQVAALSASAAIQPRQPSHLHALTGLRFIAAFAVFGFHLGTGHVLDTGRVGSAMGWAFNQGAVGVSFFFILSGFVLAWSARPGDTAARFWQRRAAKIYPNHLMTWCIAIGATLVTGSAVTIAVAVPNLLLLQAWSPDENIYFGLNTPSWSLACEVFFYACFPWVLSGARRIAVDFLWVAALAAMAMIWLIPVAATILPVQSQYWAVWIFPVARFPEFIVGVLLARIVQEEKWPRIAVWQAAVLTLIAYLLTRYLPDNFRSVSGTAVPLALLIGAVGAASAEGRRSWLASPWAVWLGEASLVFYLLQPPLR